MMDTRLAIGAGLLALMMVCAATAQELVSIDIGDAADTPGSTVIDGDTYTIEGSGSDIWNAADGKNIVTFVAAPGYKAPQTAAAK